MPRLTLAFPLFALLAAVIAFQWPEPFAAAEAAIVPLLMAVMFGMGMTLTGADFVRAVQRPRVIALGLVLQYSVMPFAAWMVAHLLGLDALLTAGMVLVGATAGGTASNVITYLARGDVALSVTLTLVSTLAAVVATPLLTWLYVGERIAVPTAPMLVSVAQIVALPVLAGVALKALAGARLRRLQPLFPLFSTLAIVVIIGIIVALNRERIGTVAWVLALAVVLHNLIGLGAGYALARLAGEDVRVSRTVAIEVGMQNSGLAVALAVKYFAPAAALPGALFSVWHNLSGALLAAYWSGRHR